jgi:hypothetical protein
LTKKLEESLPIMQDTSGGNSLEDELQSRVSPIIKVRAETCQPLPKKANFSFERAEETMRHYEMTLARIFSEF